MVLNVRARRRTSGGAVPGRGTGVQRAAAEPLRRRVQVGERQAHPPREHDGKDGRRQQAHRRHPDQPRPEHAQPVLELAGRAGERQRPGRVAVHRAVHAQGDPHLAAALGDGHRAVVAQNAGNHARRNGDVLPCRAPEAPGHLPVRAEDPDLVAGRARVHEGRRQHPAGAVVDEALLRRRRERLRGQDGFHPERVLLAPGHEQPERRHRRHQQDADQQQHGEHDPADHHWPPRRKPLP